MTSAGFVAFRERMGMTKSALSEALEIDRRTCAAYESGRSLIPRHIALACAALAHGLKEMG